MLFWLTLLVGYPYVLTGGEGGTFKRWLRKILLVQPQNVNRTCFSIIAASLALWGIALVSGYQVWPLPPSS